MRLICFDKVLRGVNTHGINRLVLCGNKVLHMKDPSNEESSVNIKIFIGLENLRAELPGLTILDFFPFGYLDDKVCNVLRNSDTVS